jgi:hypothetical protein
MQEAKQV